MEDLGELIRRANSATESAAEARKQALPATIAACRALESAVQEMLGGEPLRGLRNIGTAGEVLYGARVRTKPDTKIDHFNDCRMAEEEGRSIDTFLILDAKGRLMLLRWVLDDDDYWVVEDCPVPDDYFRVGDAEGLAAALRVVLPRHVRAANRTAKNYETSKALADRIESALASMEE